MSDAGTTSVHPLNYAGPAIARPREGLLAYIALFLGLLWWVAFALQFMVFFDRGDIQRLVAIFLVAVPLPAMILAMRSLFRDRARGAPVRTARLSILFNSLALLVCALAAFEILRGLR